MAPRDGVLVRVATDAGDRPARFVWRGVARRREVVGEWRLVHGWWVTPGGVDALGKDARARRTGRTSTW